MKQVARARRPPDGPPPAPDQRGRTSLWIMAVLLTGLVVRLSMPGTGLTGVADGAYGIVATSAPPVVCWAVVWRTRLRRADVLLATAAVTAFSAANLYFAVVQALVGEVPIPSPADAGYLLFYPLMFGALAVLVRNRARGLARWMWLDSALGALGAASVLAVVLSPLMDSFAGEPSLAGVLTVAMPVLDMVLVAAVVGIASSQGLELGRRWALLVAGLLIFAATDVVFALWVVAGTYEFGTPLDAGWAIGLGLVALWVDRTARPEPADRRPARRSTALVVPGVASAAGLGVLLLGTQVQLSRLAVVLAGVTLLAAVARTQLAFRQLVTLGELREQSRTDDLTGLLNRRALYTDVPGLLAASEGRPTALLLLDLDRFKEVNDSLGHHVGDRLLVQVGIRLAQQVREGDLLARLGGDEFAILLADADRQHAVAAALELRAVLAEPFTLEGIALQTDVSVGIALFPDQGLDLDVLLRRADMAMYRAKTARVGYRVFTSTDDTRSDTRLRTLDELRTALATEQLVVHYQPKVDLGTGAVNGVEALVRWNHPHRGLLYPDSFLELAEDAGLMRQLTQAVLQQAMAQAAVWREEGRPLRIAVNLSASSLMDAELPDQVEALLAEFRLPPHALMLEITEESLMGDRDRARSILTALRDQGIEIAVDDFGTGYSSLAYLRDLPIDELKLDRSFVSAMADGGRAAALVASTIALAHSLDLRMVAEGVESRATYTELVDYGCDSAQGYHMCPPVAAPQLDQWLSARAEDAGHRVRPLP